METTRIGCFCCISFRLGLQYEGHFFRTLSLSPFLLLLRCLTAFWKSLSLSSANDAHFLDRAGILSSVSILKQTTTFGQ